jgi:hypothetical protein
MILFSFNFLIFFQVWQDPCVAVVDDGLVVASPNLKCFKEKNKKNNNNSFFSKLFSRFARPMRSRRY